MRQADICHTRLSWCQCTFQKKNHPTYRIPLFVRPSAHLLVTFFTPSDVDVVVLCCVGGGH